jgi:hypothetical protein
MAFRTSARDCQNKVAVCARLALSDIAPHCYYLPLALSAPGGGAHHCEIGGAEEDSAACGGELEVVEVHVPLFSLS